MVRPIDTFGIMAGIFNILLSSLGLLLLIYGLLVLIGYVWGGLRKFIRIFLIPGMIVHYASHFLAVKLLEAGEERAAWRRKLIGLGVRGGREWTYSVIRATNMKDALITSIIPACISIPLALFFTRAFFLTRSLFFGWLALSVIFEGLPNTHDYQLLFLRGVADKPHAYILLPWTVIIGILAYYVYPTYAALIALGYFIAVCVILLWPTKQAEETRKKVIV
ncbi:MAG: hypothetical protein GWO20_10255 [Candidatus Korarchaeota archaeon]|nr:hypothetical protein [Candidatus Korarchaeota archaeon]